MKAMIFAAGLGTRLKPITDTIPKALVPVCGKTLLEHTCRKLMAAGIKEAVVNVHHFAGQIEDWILLQDWIGEGDGCMKIEVSDERERLLDTGGAVLRARRYLQGCGRFLIHNVDILSDCDLAWFESQVKPDAVATLLVSERKTSRYLLFHKETMRLVGWQNTLTGETLLADSSIVPEQCRALGFSGIHIVSDKVFDLMDEYADDEKFPIKDFYMWATRRCPVYGVLAQDLELLDVGKLNAIAPAEEFLQRQRM
jgi:NDP-sugar pyrophosphorylase family protein